ncbi:MAG: 2OG-Fe(II) oxygenase [Verrucomicrobiaceae bacterium]|nr:MAG: 2OG-Fe(II) oxygenase [Verrucomicrobiaceae bacterium]
MDEVLTDLERYGWSVQPMFLDAAASRNLKVECADRYNDGSFRHAGVGRGEALQVRKEIRGDEVMWLDPADASPHQAAYLSKLEELRLALNQRFFLGLFDFESHFAIYPEGAFYKAHLDRHAGTRERVVTVILYLNEDWQPGDGGELKIWTTPEGRDGSFEIIEPRMGTVVCFMAEDFWHEVLPATRQRMSITGWFRVRAE